MKNTACLSMFMVITWFSAGFMICFAAEVNKETPMEPEKFFWVYNDAENPNKHFSPSGFMGDTGDITIDEAWSQNPHSPKSCIKVVYSAQGKGPQVGIDYLPPANWAGVYWQHPANNWGKEEIYEGEGFDLSAYNTLTLWVRSDKNAKVKFFTGGINAKYGDSLKPEKFKLVLVKPEWQQIEIDLKGANLTHIIGGFGISIDKNLSTNSNGVTLYLDDIRFEKKVKQ